MQIDSGLDTLLACGWLSKLKGQPDVQRKYKIGVKYSEQFTQVASLEGLAKLGRSFDIDVQEARDSGREVPIDADIEVGKALRALELRAMGALELETVVKVETEEVHAASTGAAQSSAGPSTSTDTNAGAGSSRGTTKQKHGVREHLLMKMLENRDTDGGGAQDDENIDVSALLPKFQMHCRPISSFVMNSEQRIAASKVIKRFIMHAKKTAFVVEHDFIMATYLADKVIVYDGNPGVETTAHAPQSLIPGMNTFLKMLDITFRRDPTNYRPRINKHDSVKDQEQKKSGQFFYVDED